MTLLFLWFAAIALLGDARGLAFVSLILAGICAL